MTRIQQSQSSHHPSSADLFSVEEVNGQFSQSEGHIRPPDRKYKTLNRLDFYPSQVNGRDCLYHCKNWPTYITAITHLYIAVKKGSKKCTRPLKIKRLPQRPTDHAPSDWSTSFLAPFLIHNVFNTPTVHPCSVKIQPDLVWGVCPMGWSLRHGKECSGNRGPPSEVAGSCQSSLPRHPAKRKQQKQTVQDCLTNIFLKSLYLKTLGTKGCSDNWLDYLYTEQNSFHLMHSKISMNIIV